MGESLYSGFCRKGKAGQGSGRAPGWEVVPSNRPWVMWGRDPSPRHQESDKMRWLAVWTRTGGLHTDGVFSGECWSSAGPPGPGEAASPSGPASPCDVKASQNTERETVTSTTSSPVPTDLPRLRVHICATTSHVSVFSVFTHVTVRHPFS